MKIYHNPKCSKSRQTLEIIKENNIEPEIVLYLKDELSYQEIESLLAKLDLKPIELIRKGEAIWKENFKGKELTDDQIIKAMTENSKLIERPIVVVGEKAIIGRPPELVKNLF
ncbi:MAG: arsenate reductase (glutaredoxin) [Flavobacteriaceae bacterium]|nr:arsenate reductase (glutaredoxin) [Flavobacteriaceae bacterium]